MPILDLCDVNSQKLFAEAERFIPGGVNSPVRAFKAVNYRPRFIQSAFGAYLTDADDNEYIDYVGSWGPMILGHAHPAVVKAVQDAATHGLSYGAPCKGEVELAMEICQKMPNIEKVRMVNSGTEAAMSAIRLARAATGRNKIIKFDGCYHGHADSLLVKAGSGVLTLNLPSSVGVPQNTVMDTLVAKFNDLDSVAALFENYGNEIAAIIVEPIAANMNMVLPLPEFLPGLRRICDHYKSLLIFDEVITGFRVGLQGAQGLYGVRPDLTVLGKIIGGGMPVGAFGGRAEIMDLLAPNGPVYQAGTLSGNPLAMAAGLATIRQLKSEDYKTLSRMTDRLTSGINDLAKNAGIDLHAESCVSLFGIYFTSNKNIRYQEDVMGMRTQQFSLFFRNLLNLGVYIAPSAFEAGFMSLAHGDLEIDNTLEAVEEALDRV